ncbi:Piwi domain-containing protein [Fimicolochytrium jonesii]|uniref:Piwi domain-containing protein n=1 Tax=Fimicolochytrium jonesii TaxID=1396493 RepID=UPI0022FF15BF|nr:Piwi domain-containing protein [Fimicolochytrium jonesii]KAI8818024.1 Piwi domain-containing protein [Fimicolochytrium jonesii]
MLSTEVTPAIDDRAADAQPPTKEKDSPKSNTSSRNSPRLLNPAAPPYEPLATSLSHTAHPYLPQTVATAEGGYIPNTYYHWPSPAPPIAPPAEATAYHYPPPGPPTHQQFSELTIASLPRARGNGPAATKIKDPAALAALARPVRPNVGVRGRLVKLRANFYKLGFEDIRIHHYDVEVHPNDMAQINRKVMEVWKRTPRSPQLAAIAATAVYDGRKNLFMPQNFPLANNVTVRGKTRPEETFVVELPEEEVVESMGCHPKNRGPQKYKLRLRKVAEIQMSRLHAFLSGATPDFPRETVMVLEVMLRHRPTLLLEAGSTGGGFYTSDGAIDIRGGIAVHPGWFQSIRATKGQLLLNLDVSSTTFYQTGPLLTVVSHFFQRDHITHVSLSSPRDHTRLDKFLRDLSIEITYRTTGRRRYKIKALTPKSALLTYITTTNTLTNTTAYVSVEQYFREHYNIRLCYPQLPCVATGANLDIIIPMELCVVRPNQRHTARLNERQAAEMVRVTALLPKQRSYRIEQGKRIMHNDIPHLEAWGVTLKPHMMEIPGRILPPPSLSFQPNEDPAQEGTEETVTEVPDMGNWKIEGGLKFARGASLRFWSIAVFGDQREIPVATIQSFVLLLIDAMEKKGMTVHNTRPEIVYGPARSEVGATLHLAADRALMDVGEGEGMIRPSEVQLVICVISHKHTIYSDIKRISETEMGLMTQCAMSRQVMKLDQGYIGNLLLKLNAKLGGVNVFLDPLRQLRCLNGPSTPCHDTGKGTATKEHLHTSYPNHQTFLPTMIFGADVTHPPPGTVEGRSIAAVVSSIDSKFCEYRASIRIQGSRQEIITDLYSMTHELLDLFHERNGTYPKKIIFYRDGVSEGQFTEVAVQEIQSLKKAVRDKGCEGCGVTFLVVNKRHHVRVFPVVPPGGDRGAEAARGRPVCDRKGNVVPGTVVDSDICHPTEFDFYLTSHAGLQGTSKPAHYHVLYDENRFTADDMQELTYRLCYLYARSSRSVSIVPPAYYAHLVAARARCHAASAAHNSRPAGPFEHDADAAGAAARGKKRVGVMQIARVSEELQKKMYFT